MKMTIIFIIVLLIFCTDANSQVVSNSIEINTIDKEKLNNEFRKFTIIHLDVKKIYGIRKASNRSFKVPMDLEPNRTWELILEKNEIRSPMYQISLNDSSIDNPDINLDECTTYKGYLNNKPKSMVRLSISSEIVEGYIMDGEDLIFIKPVSRIIKDYYNEEHYVIFNIYDVIDNSNVRACGNDNVMAVKEAISHISSARATTSCRVLEIATEADFEFFQANESNVTTANNTILGILNQVEGIYQTTFNIKFLVPYQSVWSSSNDPYSAVASASGSNVLTELANWWQANRSFVLRDIVYFFSAKTGHNVKGSARVFGAICDNLTNSYAFTATAVTNELVITTAHEIGHLFNATHPNDTNPASCSPSRTIMCTDPNGFGKNTPIFFFLTKRNKRLD
jgi:hypothetical protein